MKRKTVKKVKHYPLLISYSLLEKWFACRLGLVCWKAQFGRRRMKPNITTFTKYLKHEDAQPSHLGWLCRRVEHTLGGLDTDPYLYSGKWWGRRRSSQIRCVAKYFKDFEKKMRKLGVTSKRDWYNVFAD